MSGGIIVNVGDSTKGLAGVELADGITALLSTDSVVGVARNRIISVPHDTAPVLANGSAQWLSPVYSLEVMAVTVSAGTVPNIQANWMIRYAVDPINDAAAAIMLPSAVTADGDADILQVGAFNVTPVPTRNGAVYAHQLILPQPIKLPIFGGITRLDFRHNIGAGVTLDFLVKAVELV